MKHKLSWLFLLMLLAGCSSVKYVPVSHPSEVPINTTKLKYYRVEQRKDGQVLVYQPIECCITMYSQSTSTNTLYVTAQDSKFGMKSLTLIITSAHLELYRYKAENTPNAKGEYPDFISTDAKTDSEGRTPIIPSTYAPLKMTTIVENGIGVVGTGILELEAPH